MGKKSLFTIKRIRNKNPNMMRVRVQKPEKLWRLAVLTLLVIAAGIASLLVISDDFKASFLSADGEATASGPVGNSGTYVPGSLTKEQAQAAVQGAKQGMSNGVSQTGQFLNNAGSSLNQQVKNLPAMDQKLMQGGMKDMQTMLGAGANDIGFGNKLDENMSQGAGQVHNLMANPTASLGGVNKLTGSASSAVEKLGGIGGATSSGSSGIPSTGTAGTGSITSGSAGTSSSSSSVSGGSGAGSGGGSDKVSSSSPSGSDTILGTGFEDLAGFKGSAMNPSLSSRGSDYKEKGTGIINAALYNIKDYIKYVAGAIAVLYLIVSATHIVTAVGDEGIEKAKKNLKWSIMGLICVLAIDVMVVTFFEGGDKTPGESLFMVAYSQEEVQEIQKRLAEEGKNLGTWVERNGVWYRETQLAEDMSKYFKQNAQTIFKYLKTLAGAFAILSIFMAGAHTISAGGNEERIEKEKKFLMHAITAFVTLLLLEQIIFGFIYPDSTQGSSDPICVEFMNYSPWN